MMNGDISSSQYIINITSVHSGNVIYAKHDLISFCIDTDIESQDTFLGMVQ